MLLSNGGHIRALLAKPETSLLGTMLTCINAARKLGGVAISG